VSPYQIIMNELKSLPVIGFKTARLFETWLDQNHNIIPGIWLKIFKKSSNIKSITYNEAVDVALCYGWIDSQLKSFDEKAYIQRFSPRKSKSIWSRINTERIERLIADGRMKPAGINVVERAKADGSWTNAYESQSKMTIPEDFLKQLGKNEKALSFFSDMNKTNLYAIAFRIHTARNKVIREKRINDIIEMLARKEKFH
jgi:uncharacterized protein YdeI (YjbR/CyaY-like superfamily)